MTFPILFSYPHLQEIFYCRVIHIHICRIVVVLNSTIIKWQIYSNIFISPMSCDGDSLVMDMLNLSFCWSISSTTPHLHQHVRTLVKFSLFKSNQILYRSTCRLYLTIVCSPNYLTAQWCWCARLTIGGALVAMIQTNKYLTLIKLNDISDIISF